MAEDHVEQQEMEVEALESIFMDDLQGEIIDMQRLQGGPGAHPTPDLTTAAPPPPPPPPPRLVQRSQKACPAGGGRKARCTD